jgi:peroxiredoxin
MIFIIAAGNVLAQGNASARIPAVGDDAPEFSLKDLVGEEISLSKLNADSPVVLVVLRGYPGYQCPICSVQVGGLIGKAKEINEAIAKVVMVYPGPAEQLDQYATEFIKGKKLPENFLFVTDPDYKFTQAYGLRWDAARETAYPSTFVIDQKGIVRFSKISKSHGDRAKFADILEALNGKN